MVLSHKLEEKLPNILITGNLQNVQADIVMFLLQPASKENGTKYYLAYISTISTI